MSCSPWVERSFAYSGHDALDAWLRPPSALAEEEEDRGCVCACGVISGLTLHFPRWRLWSRGGYTPLPHQGEASSPEVMQWTAATRTPMIGSSLCRGSRPLQRIFASMSKSFRGLKDRSKSAALQRSFPVRVPLVVVASAFGAWHVARLASEHFGVLLFPTVLGLVTLTYVLGRMHRSPTHHGPSGGAGAVPEPGTKIAPEPANSISAKPQSAKAGK